MKYVVIVGDGMADEKQRELGGKTPLMYARTPNMDHLAASGEMGMVKTIPDGYPPGSDVANLAVMGYDVCKYYSGRSPLEAASMGVKLEEKDAAFRCNLVTLSDEEDYENKIMVDYSSQEISTGEARELMGEIDRELGEEKIKFYAGISYRHLLVWNNGVSEGVLDCKVTPPHDIPGKRIAEFLPEGPGSSSLIQLMQKSNDILCRHPVNKKRRKKGLRPANSIWLWGQGRRPSLPNFFDRYGLKGTVISAVDLIKGIGICAGLEVVNVDGATGNIHTNFQGKAMAAVNELKKGKDFVFIHVEAPDEAGHQGDLHTKIKAIEEIDKNVLEILLNELKKIGNYKIMLLPDHPTPLSVRTHTAEPVPFVIMESGAEKKKNKAGTKAFNELEGQAAGLKFQAGHKLMDYFIYGRSDGIE